ncbi:MAG: V-type ATP synthase subunit A [Candidatus Methanofastidiosia archaeon]
MIEGKIIKISGPVVVAENMKGAKMYEVVRVGEHNLIGEIIELIHDRATMQVYEETAGLRVGEKVVSMGSPLSVKLGPGLIRNIYDGIQRPLEDLKAAQGNFIEKGFSADELPLKTWKFTPTVSSGTAISGGMVIGTVPESELVIHKILVPPNVEGKLVDIVPKGEYHIEDDIATVLTTDGEKKLKMYHSWPVRVPRPYVNKFPPAMPLVTGQRVLDTFFPIAKGGTAGIPGGFGTGKTVTQHQLAKWADAEIVVYVGCGERGNEMTQVLNEFPKLKDPRTGKPITERTVLIANTSNMPVAAREASIYTGVTIAEYFRDMGYDVALMADSTSRWAEALREISGRLEEMPGEAGFPAYLSSKLSGFYERSGRVESLCGDLGSISIIGAVSPPGGDFSEPVTQNTLRVVKVFWALDKSLKDQRHFPSINWLTSYSLYLDDVNPWWSKNVSSEWKETRDRAMELLQKENELKEIVQLIGPDALPERERVILLASQIIREDFLQQNAFHEVDSFCSEKKQVAMLKIMMDFYDMAVKLADEGITMLEIREISGVSKIARLKYVKEEDVDSYIADIYAELKQGHEELLENYKGR